MGWRLHYPKVCNVIEDHIYAKQKTKKCVFSVFTDHHKPWVLHIKYLFWRVTNMLK